MFKIGDRVRYIKKIHPVDEFRDFTVGKIYIIIEANNKGKLPFKVKDDTGYSFWVPRKNFKKLGNKTNEIAELKKEITALQKRIEKLETT